jgi:hypothetical protein
VSLLYCVSSVFCFRIGFILFLQGPVFLTIVVSYRSRIYWDNISKFLGRFHQGDHLTGGLRTPSCWRRGQTYDHTPYRHPRRFKDEIEKEIKEFLAIGHIKPSNNPFTSSVVLVLKKDGTMKMCIDYRALNKKTTKN